MSKHSPGPWKVHHWPQGGHRRPVVVRAADGIVCVMADREQAEVDARLVAAAPELLEALDGAAGVLMAYRRGPSDEDLDPIREMAIRVAEDAMRKARGEV